MGRSTHARTLLLALLLASAGGVVRAQLTPASTGEASCPCIDATSSLARHITPWSIDACRNHSECSDPTSCLLSVGQDAVGCNQAKFCFSKSYGSAACGAWDIHYALCADALGNPLPTAPTWCNRNWCYVDVAKCKDGVNHVTRSTMFPDLYYSYETCGSPYDTAQSLGANLENRVLRAGMPTMYYPLVYKYSEERTASEPSLYTDDSHPWMGAVVDYVQEIVAFSRTVNTPGSPRGIAGINYTYTSLPARTKIPGSSYTACVDDVYNGIVDFCAADFWMTSERLAKVPFTTPMHVQALELFVPQAEEVDPPLYRMVGAVFRPFHVSVWCLIACLAIFVGLLDMWLNKKIWIGKIDAARERGGAAAEHTKYFSVGLRYAYSGAFAFVNGGAEIEDDSSWPSRVLKLGWAFFIVIALGSYTANLAAFLQGEKELITSWQTMEDAVLAGKVVCTYTALESEMKSKYPQNIMRLYVDTSSILEAYERGQCDGFVAIVDEFDVSQVNYDRLCKTSMRSTGIVLEMLVGMPASQAVAAGLSVYISLLRRNDQALNTFLKTYAVVSNCTLRAEMQTRSDGKGETTPLGILNFSGTIMLMMLTTFVAVVAKVVFGEDDHLQNMKRHIDNVRRVGDIIPPIPRRGLVPRMEMDVDFSLFSKFTPAETLMKQRVAAGVAAETLMKKPCLAAETLMKHLPTETLMKHLPSLNSLKSTDSSGDNSSVPTSPDSASLPEPDLPLPPLEGALDRKDASGLDRMTRRQQSRELSRQQTREPSPTRHKSLSFEGRV